MRDIAASALLTAAAMLGAFRFVGLLVGQRIATAWEHVTATVGVTAFVSAVGFLLARSGIVGAALLLLLTGIAYDTARRHELPDPAGAVCAWLSLALLLVYIGLVRR
ncbi:hypothetical protein ACRAWG_29750 [Methylobacterium sp. P31]